MDEALIKKVLPHSQEAEQSVIGSMIQNNVQLFLVEIAFVGNGFRHPDQRAQHRLLPDNAGIITDIGGGRNRLESGGRAILSA